MRKLIPALVTASLLSSAASADILGVYAGIGNWKPDFSGEFQNDGDVFNIGSSQDGFDVDEGNQTGFYIAFEHPVPVIPNFLVTQQEMESDGAGTFNRDVTFGGQTYEANAEIDANFDLSHQDYTLYYEILDNWVNLDLGITARKFDGSVSLRGTDIDTNQSITETEKLDGTLPMLYGKARFDLPLTGLSASVILNYLSASGNTISDTTLVLGYESSLGLGVEGGIRTFSLELDDEDDFNTDLEFDGAFVNLTYHF